MNKFLDILMRCPLFAGISPQNLSAMASCLGAPSARCVRGEVIFSEGMEAFGGTCRLLLTRIMPESSAFLLRDPATGAQLLLGDVRLVAPEYLPELDEREREALGLSDDEAQEPLVLCRMAVPYARPQDAGFDLSHFVCVHSGRGIEVRRPGAPVIPLVKRERCFKH